MGSLSVTRSESLAKSWKKRQDYKGYDKTKGSSYNSWRSIRYTNKGKEIGSPSEWKDYNVFMEEVQGIWSRGNNFSYDEMLIIGKAIKEVRSNRENN